MTIGADVIASMRSRATARGDVSHRPMAMPSAVARMVAKKAISKLRMSGCQSATGAILLRRSRVRLAGQQETVLFHDGAAFGRVDEGGKGARAPLAVGVLAADD